MRFNIPLKTVMVLTLLTWPTVLPAQRLGEGIGFGGGLFAFLNPDLEFGAGVDANEAENSPVATAGTHLGRLEALRGGVCASCGVSAWGDSLTYAWHQAELFQLQGDELGRKTIVGVAEDGTKTTIECNPGPCTMGSVLKHARLSGLPMMVPLTLYSAVSDLDDSFDSAFEETNRLMQTSEFRGTDGNAASAYRVPAYTTILAEVSRQREANEKNDGKVIDGVLMDVTVQYEPPETTTVTTYVDAAETEEERELREDQAETDRIIAANCTHDYDAYYGYTVNCN